MRSNNVYRNGSNISRLVIKEEEEEEDDDEENQIMGTNMSRARHEHYPRSIPTIQLPKSSIIGTHHGKFHILQLITQSSFFFFLLLQCIALLDIMYLFSFRFS